MVFPDRVVFLEGVVPDRFYFKLLKPAPVLSLYVMSALVFQLFPESVKWFMDALFAALPASQELAKCHKNAQAPGCIVGIHSCVCLPIFTPLCESTDLQIQTCTLLPDHVDQVFFVFIVHM